MKPSRDALTEMKRTARGEIIPPEAYAEQEPHGTSDNPKHTGLDSPYIPVAELPDQASLNVENRIIEEIDRERETRGRKDAALFGNDDHNVKTDAAISVTTSGGLRRREGKHKAERLAEHLTKYGPTDIKDANGDMNADGDDEAKKHTRDRAWIEKTGGKEGLHGRQMSQSRIFSSRTGVTPKQSREGLQKYRAGKVRYEISGKEAKGSYHPDYKGPQWARHIKDADHHPGARKAAIFDVPSKKEYYPTMRERYGARPKSEIMRDLFYEDGMEGLTLDLIIPDDARAMLDDTRVEILRNRFDNLRAPDVLEVPVGDDMLVRDVYQRFFGRLDAFAQSHAAWFEKYGMETNTVLQSYLYELLQHADPYNHNLDGRIGVHPDTILRYLADALQKIAGERGPLVILAEKLSKNKLTDDEDRFLRAVWKCNDDLFDLARQIPTRVSETQPIEKRRAA